MIPFPTLAELFQKHSYRKAIVTPELSLTFGQLATLTQQLLISPLLPRSVSRVAFYLENRWEIFPLWLWALQRGATVFPLSPKFPLNQVRELVEEFSVDLVIVDDREKGDILSPHVKAPLLFLEKIWESLSSSLGRRWSSLDFLGPWDLNQEAFLFLTSGSTGEPKGVLHTLRSLLYSAQGTLEFFDFEPGDSWLLDLPVNHVAGTMIFFRTLLGGGTTVLSPMALALEKNPPQFLSLVPAQFIPWLGLSKKNLPLLSALRSMKAIVLGGAPLPSWVLDEGVELGLPLAPTYGSTETCSQITAFHPRELPSVWKSLKERKKEEDLPCGRPLPYREIRISPDNEILVKGKTLMKGYVKGREMEIPLTSEGWLVTKDLGTWGGGEGSLQEKPFLVVWGRSDGIFISGGENIHPLTIEKCLKNMKGIVEAIVVPKAHPQFGQVPVVFYQVGLDSPPTPDQMILHLKNSLPPYMVPKSFIDLDQLPEGLSKPGLKFQRKSLASLAQTGQV